MNVAYKLGVKLAATEQTIPQRLLGELGGIGAGYGLGGPTGRLVQRLIDADSDEEELQRSQDVGQMLGMGAGSMLGILAPELSTGLGAAIGAGRLGHEGMKKLDVGPLTRDLGAISAGGIGGFLGRELYRLAGK